MPKVLRIIPERRSGKDRRRIFSLHRFFYKGPERRNTIYDRRSHEERRDGYSGSLRWLTDWIQKMVSECWCKNAGNSSEYLKILRIIHIVNIDRLKENT